MKRFEPSATPALPVRSVYASLDGACDECGSAFCREKTQVANLCAECATVLFGCAPCHHRADDAGACLKCGWDGSRTARVRELLEDDALARASCRAPTYALSEPTDAPFPPFSIADHTH
jgi:predicted RNA-binding Zn-ribbon protein involved in translation (DUF1610 family)